MFLSEVHVSSNVRLGGKRHVRETCYAAFGSRIKGIPSPGNLLVIQNLRCFCRSWVRIRSFVCTLKFENTWFRKWKDTANYPYCNYNGPFTFNTLFSFLNTDGMYNSGSYFPCWVVTEKEWDLGQKHHFVTSMMTQGKLLMFFKLPLLLLQN